MLGLGTDIISRVLKRGLNNSEPVGLVIHDSFTGASTTIDIDFMDGVEPVDVSQGTTWIERGTAKPTFKTYKWTGQPPYSGDGIYAHMANQDPASPNSTTALMTIDSTLAGDCLIRGELRSRHTPWSSYLYGRLKGLVLDSIGFTDGVYCQVSHTSSVAYLIERIDNVNTSLNQSWNPAEATWYEVALHLDGNTAKGYFNDRAIVLTATLTGALDGGEAGVLIMENWDQQHHIRCRDFKIYGAGTVIGDV